MQILRFAARKTSLSSEIEYRLPRLAAVSQNPTIAKRKTTRERYGSPKRESRIVRRLNSLRAMIRTITRKSATETREYRGESHLGELAGRGNVITSYGEAFWNDDIVVYLYHRR